MNKRFYIVEFKCINSGVRKFYRSIFWMPICDDGMWINIITFYRDRPSMDNVRTFYRFPLKNIDLTTLNILPHVSEYDLSLEQEDLLIEQFNNWAAMVIEEQLKGNGEGLYSWAMAHQKAVEFKPTNETMNEFLESLPHRDMPRKDIDGIKKAIHESGIFDTWDEAGELAKECSDSLGED